MAKSIFLLFPLLSHSFQPGPVVLKEGATTTREKVVFFGLGKRKDGRESLGVPFERRSVPTTVSTLRTTFRTDDSQYSSDDVLYRQQSVPQPGVP
jgi:hypothetical protein